MTALSSSATVVGSIMFTDLVGFTEYNGIVGDEVAAGLLDRQRELVTEAIAPYFTGRVVKEIGDGLMLAFESPVEALAAAVSILWCIERARADGSFPLAMRMGMHHGQAIARGDDLVGQTVNIASRVADLAGPGELLVSDSVVAAHAGLAPAAALSPIGPARVKGVDEPIWLHRVTAG